MNVTKNKKNSKIECIIIWFCKAAMISISVALLIHLYMQMGLLYGYCDPKSVQIISGFIKLITEHLNQHKILQEEFILLLNYHNNKPIKEEALILKMYLEVGEYKINNYFYKEWLAFLERKGDYEEFKLLIEWGNYIKKLKEINYNLTFENFLINKKQYQITPNKSEFKSFNHYILLYILEDLKVCNFKLNNLCTDIILCDAKYPMVGLKRLIDVVKLFEQHKNITWGTITTGLVDPTPISSDLNAMSKIKLPVNYVPNLTEITWLFFERYFKWWKYMDYIQLYIYNVNNVGSLVHITCIKETLAFKKIKLDLNQYIAFYEYYVKIQEATKCNSYYYIFKHYEKTKGDLTLLDSEQFLNEYEKLVKKNPKFYENKESIRNFSSNEWKLYPRPYAGRKKLW